MLFTADLTSEVSQPSTTDLVGALPPPSSVAISMIMKEINIIKNDLHSLKTAVSSLQDLHPSDSALRDEVTLLRKSLNITRPPHLVSTSCSPPSNGTSASDTRPTSLCGLGITAWNCRGVSSAVPYLQVLAETSDIISISEHWLWPFELHTLDKILPGYSAHGCSDKRLSESSTLVRGYGGVAVLWKSSLQVSPVTAVKSDRCVAIQVCLTNCSLSIINVYLPTSDYPLDIFKEYLHELENTISALQSDGPVMVLGDFNAHLGSLGGQRGIGEANPQGKLLLDLICRTNLFVASLCSISSGPSYTFF